MSFTFNTILRDAGIDPEEVRLIRHKDKSAEKGRNPYELWRDDKPSFDLYQSIQGIDNRKKLSSAYWAVFNVDSNNNNMFAGLYFANYKGLLEKDTPRPHKEGRDKAGECDVYELELQESLNEFIGKLFIDWGKGFIVWIQYANNSDKVITENKLSFQEGSIKYYEFVNNDSEYLRWIAGNPHGLVINTLKGKPVNNRVLHNASCSSISKLTGIAKPGGFTEREYIKICAPSFALLNEWSRENDNKSFSSKCGKCFFESQNEDEQDVPLSKEIAKSLDNQVAHAINLDEASLRFKSDKYPKNPRVITSVTKVFDRNPYVIAMALKRAKGDCELCHEGAPFDRKSNGTPYLEVHHKVRLADGGEDTLENVIAICPNCHREEHFG
jgi:5-methylcytosine-specific restriction endonuclease McrA